MDSLDKEPGGEIEATGLAGPVASWFSVGCGVDWAATSELDVVGLS